MEKSKENTPKETNEAQNFFGQKLFKDMQKDYDIKCAEVEEFAKYCREIKDRYKKLLNLYEESKKKLNTEVDTRSRIESRIVELQGKLKKIENENEVYKREILFLKAVNTNLPKKSKDFEANMSKVASKPKDDGLKDDGSTGVDDRKIRILELRRRNSLYPQHLRSAYPVEFGYEELRTEKAQLEESVETLRETQHKTNNDKLREVEAKNSLYITSTSEPDSGNTSLSEQLSNDTLANLRQLELENQKLVAAIENLKEEAFRESSSKILELEEENKRLSLKVNQFLESSQKEKLRISEYEVQVEDCKAQIKKLEATVETLNASKDRIFGEFQTEKAQLEETVETLRETQHKTNNDKLREVEAENKSLASISHQLQSQATPTGVQELCHFFEVLVQEENKEIETYKKKLAAPAKNGAVAEDEDDEEEEEDDE